MIFSNYIIVLSPPYAVGTPYEDLNFRYQKLLTKFIMIIWYQSIKINIVITKARIFSQMTIFSADSGRPEKHETSIFSLI